MLLLLLLLLLAITDALISFLYFIIKFNKNFYYYYYSLAGILFSIKISFYLCTHTVLLYSSIRYTYKKKINQISLMMMLIFVKKKKIK